MEAAAQPGSRRAQIVTLTMNPALDLTTSVDVVRPTDKLRCETTRYDPGGGGINVARVARVLGASASAIFPAGGGTGDVVMSLLNDAGVPFQHVAVNAATRENFTVNETSTGRQYRFVLPGPRLTFTEQTRCLDRLGFSAGSAQFVVASGSLPPGAAPDLYQRVPMSADSWAPALFWTPLAADCGAFPPVCICSRRACVNCGNVSGVH